MCVADRPAGCSSSEDEFSDNCQEEEGAGSVNYAAAKSSRTVFAVEPSNSVSGAGVSNNSSVSNLLWSRDSCAKRAVPVKTDSSSSCAAESKTSNDTSNNSCPGDSGLFSHKPDKTKKSVSGNKSDVNWSWVKQVLAAEANKSTVPHGSVEVSITTFLMTHS